MITKSVDLFNTSRRTNPARQIFVERSSSMVERVTIQKAQSSFGATERWITFPEDKSIVRKYTRESLHDLFRIYSLIDVLCTHSYKFSACNSVVNAVCI